MHDVVRNERRRGTDAPALTPSRALLFGGYVSNGSQGGYYDDTWEWSGSSWSQRSSTGSTGSSGPSGRVGGALASLNGKTVLFGGYGGKTLGDTWQWDGTTWTEKKVPGPTARFGAVNASFVEPGDTWEWDGAAWTERSVTGPSPRTQM